MRTKFRLSVIAFLLIISMLLVPVDSMAAQADTAFGADSGFKLGDADNDGNITVLDATAIQRSLILFDLILTPFRFSEKCSEKCSEKLRAVFRDIISGMFFRDCSEAHKHLKSPVVIRISASKEGL